LSDEKKSSGQPSPKKRKTKKEDDEYPLQEYRLIPAEEWKGHNSGDDEIDLVELAKHIWNNRSLVYKFVAVGVLLGLAVTLLSPKEYQSGATLMPEMPVSQSGASSLLQQYGGLLGMSGSADLSSEGIIPPQLYPHIVQSLPFQLELLNQRVSFKEFDTTATVYAFFDEIKSPSFFSYITGFTIGLPGKIIGLFGEETSEMALPRGFEANEIISVTKDQMEIIENMRDRVYVSLSEETGVINLTVKMPDPNAAAQVAKTSIELIKEYVTQYRTRKAQEDLKFSQEQLVSAEERFREAQDRLAEFRDANINLSTARAQTQQQRLQSEYDLTFNVYSSMAQQVEQAKLKVQEQTPVVSVLQPVQVPVEDNTSGLRVLLLSIITAIFISVSINIFLYLKEYNAK